MRGRLLAAAAVVLLGLTGGCGGDAATSEDSAGDPSSASTPTSTKPPAEGGPLTDLPECTEPPPAVDDEVDVELVLPEGTLLTAVEDLGELVSVRGYVALTPIQVRQFYATAPGLRLYALEDEVYEAEVLYGADEHRVFVKAQAQCRQGSVLSVFVGPEDGEGLPPVTGG